ncbi:DUF2239 family protein [Ramlibacter ginsenosidimutans]|uniref:DUF2239 family protein n=1 Tax=Ramlibacter ginsenosidimutans TaxID=502333 RepID=A0A934TR78_9BURK|nr:DUF2239 family protein [Ramlibacter ginsenosidimutans]MBK6005227.1 DUF2239 family protein [Ramlibacter ginsenosidimutans]
MALDPTHTYTVFAGARRLASGPPEEVAAAARVRGGDQSLLVFDDVTGSQVELDLRGSEEQVRARYRAAPQPPEARGRGRPRLGVVAREVTLLPDQWEWLAAQPGGASVVLRKLVQEARRAGSGRDRMRRAQERCYKVMVALAGDRPGFEEAARSLFRADMETFRQLAERWPADIREHLLRLADPDDAASTRSPE